MQMLLIPSADALCLSRAGDNGLQGFWWHWLRPALLPMGLTCWALSPPQVEEFRRKDAEHGVKIAQVLQGFISRKVVKQTVMTVVYGVTRYGGRLQMEKRLKEIDDFPEVPPLPWNRLGSALSPCAGGFSLYPPNLS